MISGKVIKFQFRKLSLRAKRSPQANPPGGKQSRRIVIPSVARNLKEIATGFALATTF